MATSFPVDQIKFLLLENIHATAHELIRGEGFQLEILPGALKEDELTERLRDVHVLGIRSKTRVTEKALAEARRLLAVGCFCIGTNQVDLAAANRRGIPVFNAPFSNTRSVAELIVAEIIALARQLGDRSHEMHEGRWRKAAAGAFEVRGKTLGIVGYGHIGSQVGVLAESLGMLDDALEGVEYRESLKPLLERLPPREKRILLLRFFGNMTQSQIATELGISQMHVSRLLARTLAQLRDGLTTED